MSANLKSKFASGVFWLVATKAVAQAAAWLISLVVIRLLSPQDYGLMGMAFLVSGFLLLFSEIGLGASLIRIRDLDADEISTVAWSLLGLNVMLFLVLAASAPFIAAYFREPALTSIVRVLGVTFLINGFGMTPAFMLARDMEFAKRAKADFAGSLAGAAMTLLLAATGFGVWSLVGGHLSQSLVGNVLIYVSRPVSFGGRFSPAKLGRHLNFGFQVAAARLLWFLSANADFMVVGRMLGASQLGYYSLAFQLATIPIDKGVSIVTQSALPLFSASQDDDAALRRHFLKLAAIVALLTSPVFLGVAAISDMSVRLFLRPEWFPAVLPLQILCVVSVWRAIVMLNAPLLTAKGKPWAVTRNAILQIVTMPVAFYVATRFGLVGVSLVWVLVWPISAISLTWQTLRIIDLRLSTYLATLMHPILGASLMAFSVIGIQKGLLHGDASRAGLILSIVAGALIYGSYNVIFNKATLVDTLALLRSSRRSTPAPPVRAEPLRTDGAGAARIVTDVSSV